jgi:sulfatase maturation enzyme AslB (radical SAM superfamily)
VIIKKCGKKPCHQDDGHSTWVKIAQGLFKLKKFEAKNVPVNQTMCYKDKEGKYVFEIIERKDSTVECRLVWM